MRTILVTGSDGFIGRHLVQALAARPDIALLTYDVNNQPAELDLIPIVRLYRNGEVLRTSAPDEQGQFAFRAVIPGVYDLGVMLGQREIVLESLELTHD